MANPSGVLTVAAVKRPAETSAWGTAATSPTNIIPLINESMTTGLILDHEEAVEASAARQDADIVGEDNAGSITTDVWYEGLEYMLNAAFGFECPTVYSGGDFGAGTGGSPAPDTIVSPDAYHHVLELDNALQREVWLAGERDASSGGSTDPEYWTAADQKVRAFDLYIDKKVPTGGVHGFINCMVRSTTLKCSLESVTMEWDLVGYQHLTDTYNRSSWALPSSRVRAIFPHLSVGLSAAGASAPTAVAVQDITLKLENQLESTRSSGSNSKYIIEPVRSGVRKVSGTIKLARYNDDTFPDALKNETDMQLNLTLSGNTLISGSAWYPNIRFFAPLVRITKADFPVSGAGVITGDLEFEAFVAATPTWITTAAGGVSLIKAQELYCMYRNTRGWCWSRDRQDAGLGALP